MDESIGVEAWGLPTSLVPRWVGALDWLRRRLGYRLRGGQRLDRLLSRHLPPTLDTTIVPGISVRLDLRQEVSRATWWAGRGYEAPTPDVLRGWLSEGVDRFFDIGANCGWFSYFALSSSKAEVHAFEPQPDLFQQLDVAKSVNSLDRFHPHQIGLSDSPGALPLHRHSSQTGYSTFGPHPQLSDAGVLVHVARFDDWRVEAGIELPDRPSWVGKIDVEGYEANVLRGMAKSLEARAFAGLVVELNPFTLEFCGSSPIEVLGLLEGAGYQMLRVKNHSRTLNRFFVPQT